MYYDFGRFENIVSAFPHVCCLRSRCDGGTERRFPIPNFPATPCCSTSFTSHTHGSLSKRAILVADFPYSHRFENTYSRFCYIGLFIIPPSAYAAASLLEHIWRSLLIVLLYGGIEFHSALSDQVILSRRITINSKYSWLAFVCVLLIHGAMVREDLLDSCSKVLCRARGSIIA